MPSDPARTRWRSYPVAFFTVRAPLVTSRPSPVTTRAWSTESATRPTRRRRGDRASAAITPPTVESAGASLGHSWPPSARMRELADPHAGLDDRDHLLGFVRDEPVEPCRPELAVDLARVALVRVVAAADDEQPKGRGVRGADRLDDVGLRVRVDQLHAPSPRSALAPAAATPAAGSSAHRVPSGRTLSGFIRSPGSKAPRTHACAARSSADRTSGRKSRFSSPIPCPRERAAEVDREPHDLLARGQDALEHTRLARVEVQMRVQVAVARMGDARHGEIVPASMS